MLFLSRFVVAGALATCVPFAPLTAQAQDKSDQSILVLQESVSPDEAGSTAGVSLASAPQIAIKVSDTSSSSAEIVRDRYPTGKVHIERSVVLDDQGNFVNDGEYREYSDKGELSVTGAFEQGKRVGVWVRFLSGADSKLLSTHPLNKFRPPFTSTVEFSNDKMNGVWVIADKDKKIALQIELREGVRQGTATLFYPNGQIYKQSHYNNGQLDGLAIEKSLEGKLVTEDHYTDGQKLVVETEHYPNKHVKSVTRYLTAPMKLSAQDDWLTTTLAVHAAPSGKQPHGEFVTYHENGQIASRGQYDHGKLNGNFESWYGTGEVATSGQYEQGQQVGPWLWRHPNGMKKAVATYIAGKPDGEIRSWDERGKAVIR